MALAFECPEMSVAALALVITNDYKRCTAAGRFGEARDRNGSPPAFYFLPTRHSPGMFTRPTG